MQGPQPGLVRVTWLHLADLKIIFSFVQNPVTMPVSQIPNRRSLALLQAGLYENMTVGKLESYVLQFELVFAIGLFTGRS